MAGARRRRITRAAMVLAIALPLSACAASPASSHLDLRSAGCPDDIRIQTDAMPRVELGFLYGLLDPHHYELGAHEVSGPLVFEGRATGVRLTILTGDATDGVSGNVALYDDPSLLLAAVDTDQAMVDSVRYPTVGVFAPLAKDPRIIYWDANVYPKVSSIGGLGATLTPDGSTVVPVVAAEPTLFDDYLLGKKLLRADQVTVGPVSLATFARANGISAQQGDALIDPYVFAQPDAYPDTIRSQFADDVGYTRDAGVLSARRQTIVRYADCLRELVPLFQRSLIGYVTSPDATTALIVDLAAAYGDDTYPTDVAVQAATRLSTEHFVGNGRDDTVGDLDIGRVRGLIDDARPLLIKAGVDVPSRVQPDDFVTNEFIDRSIGF
ncbi:MAG: hypothetical protein ABIR17_06230 [Pseudolysinimonas sp.]|uniref:hypothetical protein n=1 Tax=Pseudolysinimonas sp. TaxID=2680009 RepID=UPI0032662B9D